MIVEWAAEAETKEKAQQILRDIIIALMPKPNQMSFLAKEGEKKWKKSDGMVFYVIFH